MSPIGSLLGGPLSDTIGRRNNMILNVVIFLFAWILVGFSQSYSMICAIFLLFGLTIGVNEAATVAYVTEIWYVDNELLFGL